MPGVGKRAIAGALLALVALVLPAFAQDHPLRGVALVIGQSAYTGLPKLANPGNDAAAMGELLGQLGFAVTSVADGDHAGLSQDLAQFEAAAKDADVALVYYSGHGIEAGGENYLVPVDADISTPAKAGATLLPVSNLLDELARTVPVTIVLLDACRSDAFPKGTMIQLPGTAEPVAAQQTGLGELRGPAPVARPGVPADNLGMVIGFAASPGQPALDGAPGEPNSPYAAALLKHLAAGGYSFGDLMTMVSEEVYLKTRARQLPWVNSSLRRILSFGRPAGTDDPDQAAIKTGRRQLLLTIAGAPGDTRAAVETVAAQQGVPLDQVYGMLAALGVDTSDPAALQAQLAEGAERIKRLAAESRPVTDLADDVRRAAALADEAWAEGAFTQALEFRERAVDAARQGAGTDAKKVQFAALLAQAAEAEWSLFKLDEAAGHFAEAEAAVADFDQGLAAHYKKLRADALAAKGEFTGDNDAFDQAISLYDEALTYYDDQPDDDIWADTANDFAIALARYGERRDDDEYLNDSVNAFSQVLGIWTRESKPMDWARTQNNLGNSYASLGDRNQETDKWRQAISAYREALEVWTRDAAPLDWARAQNNLGTMQHTIGNYEKDEDRLKSSIKAYEDALEEWTRARSPYDWAMVENNLGNALTDLAKVKETTAGYDEGIAAYQAALEVWTRDRLPLDWATVQNNLGATYGTLGRQLKGGKAVEAFHKAVAAYGLCLEERTKDRDPRNWALTEYNLGLVLTDLSDVEDGTDALRQAVDAFNASLEIYTEAESPTDWADTQEGLGWVLANLGARTRDRDLIVEGRAAMEEALRIYQEYDGAGAYYQDKLDRIDEMLKAVS